MLLQTHFHPNLSIFLPLGFLNANPIPHLKARVANYGLMDQIAALHWVQQNIALFGGDAGNVTMLGHGSGAACINFLMISPTVMPGKFWTRKFVCMDVLMFVSFSRKNLDKTWFTDSLKLGFTHRTVYIPILFSRVIISIGNSSLKNIPMK